MSEKSHVGMDLCFLCNEPKGVVLDRRLRNTLPRQAVYDYEPCPKCKEYMQQGIIVISVDEKLSLDKTNPYRTGGWCVLKEEAVRRMIADGAFLENVLQKRVCFIPDGPWMEMGLPYGDKQKGDPGYGPRGI